MKIESERAYRRTKRPGDSVVWLALAACGGGLFPGTPTLSVVVVAAVTTLLVRAGARWLALLLVPAFLVSAWRAKAVVGAYEAARTAIVEEGGWPARCDVRGTIASSPSVVGGGLRLDIDAKEIHCRDGPATAGRVAVVLRVVETEPSPSLAHGDEVSAIASLAPPYRFWNDDVSDPRPSASRRGVVLSGGAEDVVVTRAAWGVRSSIDRARIHLRNRIVATFPPDTAPMARALVLGEDDLAEEDQRAFRRSGLAHLLAVSGMHLVLVVMGFVAALRALLVRAPWLGARFDVMRAAAFVGLPFAWMYAELAGGSGSAVRAAWMCTVVLAARVLGRRTRAWRALGLSVLAMTIADPLVAVDVSFVLSALATAGLLAFVRPIEASLLGLRLRGRALPSFLTKPLATTAAATLACAPVLATMAPELSFSGLLANVVAVPIGEAVALPLCLVHGLLSAWPAAERGCAVAASGALFLVRLLARSFTWGAVPIAAPTPLQIAAIVVATAGAALGRPRRWLAFGAVALIAFELVARDRGAPRGVLRVTFIDVGQGDAALVDLPDGSAMLIDGGGLVGSPIDVGARAVAAVLGARRRQRLDTVVLSHPHPDHYLGLSAALTRRSVGAFWDTGQGELEGTSGAYAAVLGDLRARKTQILRPSELCGRRTLGGATVEVLAPCPRPSSDRGPNDNSFVVRLRFGERAVLFVGDAEREEEAELVRRFGADELRADVLKVGHHGSRTSSSPAFLSEVAPEVAVISCGVRNRFGHPHASTLAALEAARARTFRTDRDGSVVVTTDGRELEVRAMRAR